jgi:hypothetical protein
VSPSFPIVLASRTINRSGDLVTVELIQPDPMPAAVRIVWPTAPTITTPPATTKSPAQPCAYSLRRPSRWPESEQVNGCDGADRLWRPHRCCWIAAFGRLTSAAYQPSGGPLPQYPSSRPRVSCMESA